MGTMSLRFLFGMLSSGISDHHHHPDSTEILEKAEGVDHSQLLYINQEAVKFHIGMLTVSLILGLAYGGFVVYTWWMEKDVFLGYIRNLVIALVCRTFFTVLFDGVILLGSLFNAGGGNTLLAFEQIFINLVLGFWLSLTIYMHARVQRNFKSEPTLRLYQYGIPVVAFFFAFVWIMLLQQLNPIPQVTWWVFLNPLTQWVVNSANLLFLLIQLGLVADMCRMMAVIKSSLDNDSVSLLWKVAAILGALVFIFWFQFGFSLGLYAPTESYLYFFYFIDGLECALVCVCLFFFNKWVVALLINNKSIPVSGPEESAIAPARSHHEELLNGGRGIVTIDSMLASREDRLGHHPPEDAMDVVYSNVVEPHRLQKTLELYKRFNVIQKQVTVVEGEKFYDCQIPVEYELENYKPAGLVTHQNVETNIGFKNERMSELPQKKNAFYASKYLVLDSKEEEIPKYLETRPSLSSMSEKDNQKEERTSRIDIPASLDVADLVRKWLNDSSENTQKNKKATSREREEQESRMEIPQPKLVSEVPVDGQDIRLHQDRPPEDNFLGKGGNEMDKEKSEVLGPGGVVNPEVSEQNSRSQINNQIESVQNVPQEKVDKSFLKNSYQNVDLGLKTEHDFSMPNKNESAEVAEEIKKHIPVSIPPENVLGQSPVYSKLESTEEKPKGPNETEVIHAPTTVDEPDAESAPKQTTPFLTYSELLEFRSKRDSSADDKPPVNKHSLSESIFSTLDSLLNVGGIFLNSITGFSQAEDDSKQDVRLPDGPSPQNDLKAETEVKAENLKELQHKEQTPTDVSTEIRYEAGKASNLQGFHTSPEVPTVHQPTLDVDNNEFPFKSKYIAGIKNDGFEKEELDQQKAFNEPYNVKPNQERRPIPLSDNLKGLDLVRDEKEALETPSDSEFTMKGLSSEFPSKPFEKPLQDQHTDNFISPDLREKLDSSFSEFERLSKPIQNLQRDQLSNEITPYLEEKSDLEATMENSTSSKFSVERVSTSTQKPLQDQRSNEQIIPEFREKLKSEFTKETRFSSSSSEFSMEQSNQTIQNLQQDKLSNELSSQLGQKTDSKMTMENFLLSGYSIERLNKPIQKPLQDHRSDDLIIPESQEKLDSEFNREKRYSSSSSEFSVERFNQPIENVQQNKLSGALTPELREKWDLEFTKEKRLSSSSSSSELSIERLNKPAQKSLQDQRSNDLTPEVREKSDPEFTRKRRLSSSSTSSSEFSVVKYCTKVMDDTKKIENQLGRLHPMRKN